MDPEMKLNDLSEECRGRIEDYEELIIKLERNQPNSMPYATGDIGNTIGRQDSSEDENPMTVF
jgi:hypothetical protein